MRSENLKIFAEAETCPARNVLDRFGDKWSTLVILVLNEEEKLRFNELHKVIGDISQKMLTVTLRNLEADGLASRKIHQSPIMVMYVEKLQIVTYPLAAEIAACSKTLIII